MNKRRGVLIGVGVAVAAVAAVTTLPITGGSGSDDRFVPRVPRTAAPEAAPEVSWWTPVHGEPLGVAVDGDDVAAAALDEVRLLDARTGEPRWRASVPGVRLYRPAIAGDRVVATSESEIVLLDRANGRRVASAAFAGPGPSVLARRADGRLVAHAASESGAIVALDAAGGAPLWAARFPGSVTVAPVSDGDVVVASWHTSDGATVRALDLVTGAARWQVAAGRFASAPALARGLVVLAEGDRVHEARVRAVDARTGQERWAAALPGWFQAGIEPAVDGSTLYLLDALGTVSALDLDTGAVRWQRDTGYSVVWGRLVLPPASAVFRSFNDDLVVLDRSTGALRSATRQAGVPIDLATTPDRLVLALRLAAPSRIEARPAP